MSDFVMQIGADLDLSKVQEQLDSIKKQKVTLDVEIKGNDDAHNLAKSIEKGLKATKIDTSGLSKQFSRGDERIWYSSGLLCYGELYG